MAYSQHTQCNPSTRENPRRCADCFTANFGDLIAARRCWYCSTDSIEWGAWNVADGHIACRNCATRVTQGVLRFVRSRALYRIEGGSRTHPGYKRHDVYYHIVDFKESRDEYGYLATPLGNALGRSVLELSGEEGIEGALVVPMPSYDPSRDHVEVLTRQASEVLDDFEVRYDVLRKVKDVTARGSSLNERFTNNADAFEADDEVDGRVVIVTDDVFTAGTTLHGCAIALLDSGATAVYGATIGRVVHAGEEHVERRNGTTHFVRYREMDDDGRLRLAPDATVLKVRLGCSTECPRTAYSDWISLPAPGRTTQVEVACGCGTEHELRVVRDRRGICFVDAPAGRRASEILYCALP